MPSKELFIREIGSIARDLLDKEQEASVMGATSHGIFLQLPLEWVIFLTPEAYRGPLTLNFSGDAANLRLLKSGQPARISPDNILIPDLGLVIHTKQASSWKPHPPPQKAQPPAQRKAQLSHIARHALARQQTSVVSALLPALLGLEDGTNAQGNTVFSHLGRLRRALEERKIATMAEGIEVFLGLGSGLTPSGDDLLVGFLLALTRWGHVLASGLQVKVLAQHILPLAYRKTTTLAANLIECALQGQANERLLLALDGIMTGNPDAAMCAAYLADWGNTSGLDTLAGMVLALDKWNLY